MNTSSVPTKQLKVVVWDPKNEFWEGSLVEPAKAAPLATRGVEMLPCDSGLFKRGTGYARRPWGAGFPLDVGSPRMHAPISMLLFRHVTMVHWVARLASSTDFDLARKNPGFRPGGMLRFVGDGREGVHHINVVPDTPAIDIHNLADKDVHGGWTIRGSGRVQVPVDSHYGFALYGMGAGLRVVWLAMTITGENI